MHCGQTSVICAAPVIQYRRTQQRFWPTISPVTDHSLWHNPADHASPIVGAIPWQVRLNDVDDSHDVGKPRRMVMAQSLNLLRVISGTVLTVVGAGVVSTAKL